MPVEPSYLTSDERSELQELHGLCWNTYDSFEDDEPTWFDIQQYHRDHADGGHWYLPFHPSLKHEKFATELEAYQAAAKSDGKLS
jgi:hypothetical protein